MSSLQHLDSYEVAPCISTKIIGEFRILLPAPYLPDRPFSNTDDHWDTSMELFILALHGVFYLLPHDLDFDHAMCLNSISCMNMNFVGEVGSFSSILVCCAFIERSCNVL